MSARGNFGGTSARDMLQRNLQRSNLGSVRFMFDVPQDSKAKACSVVLGCSACSEVLSYDPTTRNWVCNTCGCVVEPNAFLVLTQKVKAGLKLLISDADRKKVRGRWSLAGLLGLNRR